MRAGDGLPSPAPYFLDYVRATTAARLARGNPRIYTTLDPSLQRAAEAAVARGLDRLESAHRSLRRSPSGERIQAALVALDPATGEIRALVGGRDYELSAFNRVDARAPPAAGSAFKPFVFLAALRRGSAGQPPAVTPASVVEDLPIEVETLQEPWAPRNFEDRFDGLITVRQALERSLQRRGRPPRAGGRTRRRRSGRRATVGFTSRMTPVPALALGSFEVTPLELAAAYATLANGGTRGAGRGVRMVAGRPDGPRTDPEPRVDRLRPDEAYLVTNLLRGWWTVAPARACEPWGWRAPSRARPGRPTTRAMHGSPATRPGWSRWSGSGSTMGRPLDCPARAPRCRSGPTSCGRPPRSRIPGSSRCRRASSFAGPAAARPTRYSSHSPSRSRLAARRTRHGPRVCRPTGPRGRHGHRARQPPDLPDRRGDRAHRPPGRWRRRRASAEERSAESMTADDLFLRAQAAIDRLVRRLRLGAAPVSDRRRLLIVQIDGLSRTVLKHALARGHMPVLRDLVEGGQFRLQPMTVGMPTSTPAFHMATMYGVQPDIPGLPLPRQAPAHRHPLPAGGPRGVRRGQPGREPRRHPAGGSVYGCAFTGGAENDFFSFARLTRPRRPGLLRVLSAFVLVGWVAAKCAALTGGRAHPDARPRRPAPGPARAAWLWFKKRVAVSVWTRQWFTFAVARDIYDGVPAIYVNYLDYDEGAHAFGPRSGHAFAGLRAIDRSLRQIRRALRRVPGYRYDLYVLADHGQAACTPYSGLAAGRRFERAFFDEILADARLGRRRGAGDRGGVRPLRRLAAGRGPLRASSTSASSPISTSARPASATASAWSRPARTRSCTSWILPSPFCSRRSRPAGRGCPRSFEERPGRLRAGAREGRARLLLARPGLSARGCRSAAPSRSERTAGHPAGPDGADGHAERRRPRRLRHRRAGGSRVLHRRGGRARRAVARGAPHLRRGALRGRRARPRSTIRSSSTSCSSATSRRRHDVSP